MSDLSNKDRLDAWLVARAYFKSRDRANEAIKNGQVEVNGKIMGKPAFRIGDGDVVRLLKKDFAFVGRGALKLKAAVEEFGIKITGKICLDIGVATGGFSDYLLQNGAAKVYGVDIGKGQIVSELLNDQRFVFRNFTDATKLKSVDFPDQFDLIVIDVSFVSIEKFLSALQDLMSYKTVLLALIKPQFESGQSHSGVLKNQKIIQRVLSRVKEKFTAANFQIEKTLPSPVLGKEGNQEYLWLIKKGISN